MLNIDYIIFDVDGTLVDSRKDIVNAVNYVLRALKLKEKPASEIISYVGTGVEDLVKGGLGEENLSYFKDASHMLAEYYLKNPALYSTIYPNVKETLEYFKNKKKYVMSNRKPPFAKATLEALGLADYFEEILGAVGEDCRKPSTCIIDRHPELSQFDRAKAIMVGDMAIDIQTGKALGIKTCWVTYGLGKKEEVAPLKPDFIINDMASLKKIISL